MRTILAILVAAVLGCGFTGDASRFGASVLVVNNMAEPSSLDPALQSGVEEMRITLGLFEGLFAYDEQTLTPIPGVAERHDPSPDGIHHRFRLRAAQWSNGDAVTAFDFVYAWRRVLTPPGSAPPRSGAGLDYLIASPYADLLYCIAGAADYHGGRCTDFAQVGVRAVDERELEVTLVRPTPWFPELLCFPTFMPVHRSTVETHRERWTRPENFVGNGPFVLAERVPGDSLRVARNPRYWDADSVGLDGVVYLSTDQVDTALDQFSAGESDWVRAFNPKKARAWRADPDLSRCLRSPEYLGTYFYRLNVRRAPLDDRRVRRALSLAIDRLAIATHLTGLGETPAAGLVPPCIATVRPWRRLEERVPLIDVESARALLADAGFAGGEGFPELTLAFNSDVKNRAVAEAVQRQWREHLGIVVRLENREKRVHIARERALDYDISRGSWIGDYSDPATFLELMRSSGGNNRSGFASATYDDLLDSAATELDEDRRREILQRAEEHLIVDEAALLPIYYFTTSYVLRPGRFDGIHENARDLHPPKAIRPAAR